MLREVRRDRKRLSTNVPIYPVILKWSSYDEGYNQEIRKHNLAMGEEHPIDLCHEFEIGKRILHFQPHLAPKLLEMLGPGKYKFKIQIYGDNFKSKAKEIKVKFTDTFGELNFLDNVS